MTIYTLVFSAFSILKHRAFNSFAWDLGIYNQAFWTTANFEGIFYNTCELHLVEGGSFFGVHFSPILFLLVPIYRVFPCPETLLMLQSLVLGAAAYPLYLIGSRVIDRRTGLLASVIYLCNPVVHGLNCYDFHVQSLIPLSIFLSIYFYEAKKWVPFVVTTIMTLMIEEHLTYVIVAYSLYLLLRARQEKKEKTTSPGGELVIPFLLLLLGFFWHLFSRAAIGCFNPSIPETLRASRHFNALGVDDPENIPLFVLFNPLKVVGSLSFSSLEKIAYLFYLVGPCLYLPFLNPLCLLPTLPWLAISLLSNYPPYYNIGFQYPAYALPFILYAFVEGQRRVESNIRRRSPESSRRAWVMCTTASLVFLCLASPLSPWLLSAGFSPAYLAPSYSLHSEFIRRQLRMIPEDSSVLTQDNVFPHISSRKNAYVLPPKFGMEEGDWNRSMENVLDSGLDHLLLDVETDQHGVLDYAFEWVERNDYAMCGIADGVFLFRRVSPETYPISEALLDSVHDMFALDGACSS